MADIKRVTNTITSQTWNAKSPGQPVTQVVDEVTVSSMRQDNFTAAALRDLVGALDQAKVPDSAKVFCQVSADSRLIQLSVESSVAQDEKA